MLTNIDVENIDVLTIDVFASLSRNQMNFFEKAKASRQKWKMH